MSAATVVQLGPRLPARRGRRGLPRPFTPKRKRVRGRFTAPNAVDLLQLPAYRGLTPVAQLAVQVVAALSAAKGMAPVQLGAGELAGTLGRSRGAVRAGLAAAVQAGLLIRCGAHDARGGDAAHVYTLSAQLGRLAGAESDRVAPVAPDPADTCPSCQDAELAAAGARAEARQLGRDPRTENSPPAQVVLSPPKGGENPLYIRRSQTGQPSPMGQEDAPPGAHGRLAGEPPTAWTFNRSIQRAVRGGQAGSGPGCENTIRKLSKLTPDHWRPTVLQLASWAAKHGEGIRKVGAWLSSRLVMALQDAGEPIPAGLERWKRPQSERVRLAELGLAPPAAPRPAASPPDVLQLFRAAAAPPARPSSDHRQRAELLRELAAAGHREVPSELLDQLYPRSPERPS